MRVIGTCSLCGGAVAVPTAYHSVVPPVPQCMRCGARARQARGPVIPMVRPGSALQAVLRPRKEHLLS